MMIFLIALFFSGAEPIEKCRVDVSQAAMNECAELQAVAADTLRKSEFARLVEQTEKSPHLPLDERSNILNALHRAEESWESFRDAECHKTGVLRSGSGGIWQYSIC